MTRTLLLAALAVAGIVTAFLLPRAHPRSTVTNAPVIPATRPMVTGAGSLSLTARPARRALHASGDDVDLVLELQAATSPDGRRAPVDFALVLDRSGSMTGTPLDKAKDAAKKLVSRLGPDDRLSVVHFGSDARLALAETAMDGEGRERAVQAIDAIEATGGTNIGRALMDAESALDAGGRRENAVRRIVLLSDGEANEGLVGARLVELAHTIDHEGTRLSALGLGVDFDEDLMLGLADAGGGQYRYLASADEVEAALAKELVLASTTAASGVSLALKLPADVELSEVVGYPSTISDGAIHVTLSDFAAGELRRVVVRLHAREGSVGTRELARATLDYTDALAHRPVETTTDATALATNDAAQISASYDQEATKRALQARLGQTLNDAAVLYEKDDVAGAKQEVEKKVAVLRDEARAMGDEGFAGGLASEGQQAIGRISAAPAASAMGHAATKSMKAFALESERR